jgi:Predicted NTPase (NACHT family)
MSKQSADAPIHLPAWLVRLCKWGWDKHSFLFGTIILSGILNIVNALPLIDPATLHTLPLTWLFSHWLFLLGIFVGLVILTVLCGLIARLNAPLSKRQLRKSYLEQTQRDTELAKIEGIPTGLIAESVRLADIYISPCFYANRSRVDFPISDKDLERYKQSLKQGLSIPDLERILFEVERNWQHDLKKSDRVGLDVVWQQYKEPKTAIVIQGYPGMGKSTLMKRLALFMARRGLRQPDSTLQQGEQITPVLIPILLRLSNYAQALEQGTDLSLPEYLRSVLDQMDLPGLAAFMKQCLLDGTCLVMLDGLDEVSDQERRTQVQKEIREFVSGNCHRSRFIITSRVAGYDQAAFPDYPHFTLAELDDEEIDFFLPRWCRANLDRRHSLRTTEMSETSIAREVAKQTQELTAAIKDNQSVRELVSNPLLLTLMLVLQQNSIVLPRQRVELYDTVTKTLLENRNLAKGLIVIPEFQAIERLGPLAFKMQEAGDDFARLRDVEAELKEIIGRQGGTDEEISTEAQNFLQRIRERGGIFVSRVGDYFGFMHRTFQEYFAARYMLNQMKSEQQHWIDELVQRARRQDALWREPFLLAVAYQSNDNELIANKILETLLADTGKNSFAQELAIVSLAANAIIEAKSLTLSATLQTNTAQRLLTCYEKALYIDDSSVCKNIEQLMQRWLCSLPDKAYRLPLLDVISQAIKETQQVTQQYSVLTLLALIVPKLEPCPGIVFEELIPPLLTLAGLPTIGTYHPTADLASSSNFDVTDLALCVLSFLGKHGPAGLYLEIVRDYFDQRPEHLRLLAQYSLESGVLITPVLIPLTVECYKRYEAAIAQWSQLQRYVQKPITEQDVTECLAIEQALLACAEGVSYPTTQYLLAMAERSAVHTEQLWSEVWKDYLLEQLNTGSYAHYREATLLWNTLFPGEQLQPLVESIKRHFAGPDFIRRRYAQRVVSYNLRYLNNLRDLRDLRDLSNWRNLVNLNNLRDLRDLINLRYLNNLSNLSDLKNLSNWRDLRDLSNWKYWSDLSNWRYWRNLRYLNNLRYLSDLRNLINLRDLSNSLMTREIIDIARASLPAAKEAEKIDLLAILAGRMLQFQDNSQSNNEVEAEVQLLALTALQELAAPDIDVRVQEAALDVLRVQPARTVAEIALIWEILANVQDEPIQKAYALALEQARPSNIAAWQKLAKGKSSSIEAVRVAVEDRMRKRESMG